MSPAKFEDDDVMASENGNGDDAVETASSAPSPVQGAKRRKPLKTSKVTKLHIEEVSILVCVVLSSDCFYHPSHFYFAGCSDRRRSGFDFK